MFGAAADKQPALVCGLRMYRAVFDHAGLRQLRQAEPGAEVLSPEEFRADSEKAFNALVWQVRWPGRFFPPWRR